MPRVNAHKKEPAKKGVGKAGAASSVGNPGAAAGVKTAPTAQARVRKRALHPLQELLGETVRNASGDTVNPRTFEAEDGVVGLYFSANWCPPCRTFTPMLMLLYAHAKEADKKFEVIFVSFDRTEQVYKDYLAKMPWWAVDFDDSDRRDAISSKFGIKGIPVLIFLDSKTLEVITLNGRDVVMLDPEGDYFPWKVLPDPHLPETRPASDTAPPEGEEEPTPTDPHLAETSPAHETPSPEKEVPTLQHSEDVAEVSRPLEPDTADVMD